MRRRDGLCCEGTVADLQAALRYFEYLDDGERERISDLADAIWKSELEVDPVPLVSTCSSELQDNRSQKPLAPADSLAAALQSLASYLSVSFGTLTPSSFVSRQSSSDATSQLDARRKAARVALSGVDNLAWRKSQDRHKPSILHKGQLKGKKRAYRPVGTLSNTCSDVSGRSW